MLPNTGTEMNRREELTWLTMGIEKIQLPVSIMDPYSLCSDTADRPCPDWKVCFVRHLCSLLAYPSNMVILAALDGLEQILKVGEVDKGGVGAGEPTNPYALFIEECGGMERVHHCQYNADEEIYTKAYNIMEKYF